jgi:hypothetical protein
MMLSNVLKKRSLILIVLLSCAFLNARWIPFTQNALPDKPQIELLSADAFGINIRIRTTGAIMETVDTKEMLNTQV